MSEVTKMLRAIQDGDTSVAEQLLPLVYNDLRKLARYRLANERSGQSLQATALVHEAYIRLVGGNVIDWNGAGHFFGAAAEAMRRILIDRARKRATQKDGGDCRRIELTDNLISTPSDERLVELDDALDALAEYDVRKAEVVKLRFFAGLTNDETAAALGIATATAQRDWLFARAWLHRQMKS